MERRSFASLLLTLTTGSLLPPVLLKASVPTQEHTFVPAGKKLPENLPANIKQLIDNVLRTDYKTINTDWFGSIQIEGLLRFAKRDFSPGLVYANNWFNYHIQHDKTLSDEEYYKSYEGNKARILRDGPLTFAIYSAILGVAFPVHDLFLLTKNPVARQVCLDVADAILHYAARDRFGMLAHDDYNFTEFAIPDTAYWATRANAIAAQLSTEPGVADVYWKQSIYQLEQGIKYFLDKEKGIVRTGLFKGEPASTYWCRSQGWLLWAIAGLLRYLPADHPKFKRVAQTMEVIALGIQKYQSPNGALRVLVNDPASPEELTGTAMALSAIKEGWRKGWIKGNYNDFCNKSWNYIVKSVDDKGVGHNVYTGWAVSAEKNQVHLMDERFMGFVPGIIMVAADEMTR